MTDREIRRLTRDDLLKMVINLLKENRKLYEEKKILESRMDDIRKNAGNSESLASAALRMSGIFEAADRAAGEYIKGIKERCERGREHDIQ